MEKDASDIILEEANIKYKDPRVIMIVNIVNTIAFAMSINIETQKEFIINGTMCSIDKTTMSQTSYEKKEREMANKGKRVASYKDYFNSALMYYTLGMFLIAVQTSIPSIKTRKTHPGCVRSFSGYPFEGAGDLSSLTYLACIVFDIKDSVEPWNILKKKKIEDIRDKIRNSIDEILKDIPEVQMKVREKTAYLLTDFETEIPQEHDIANWNEFLPPLNPFKMKSIENISTTFSSSLKIDLKGGLKDQREKLLVIESKIIQFSLALQEAIAEVVKKNHLVLFNSNREPYLENACCETSGKETTIQFFIDKNPNIEECVICNGTMLYPRLTKTLRCGHRFHRKCIDEWTAINPSCPSCRTSIEPERPYHLQRPISMPISSNINSTVNRVNALIAGLRNAATMIEAINLFDTGEQ
jgi:hypothetical protein